MSTNGVHLDGTPTSRIARRIDCATRGRKNHVCARRRASRHRSSLPGPERAGSCYYSNATFHRGSIGAASGPYESSTGRCTIMALRTARRLSAETPIGCPKGAAARSCPESVTARRHNTMFSASHPPGRGCRRPCERGDTALRGRKTSEARPRIRRVRIGNLHIPM